MSNPCTRWDLGRSLEARIGEYEAALRAWQATEPGEGDSPRDAALRHLANEHEFRMLESCRRLRVQPSAAMNNRPTRLHERSPWSLLALAACIGLALAIGKMIGQWGLVAMAAAYGAWFAGRRARGFQKPEKAGWRTRTLRDRTCASCDYELSGHDDAIPPTALGGWKIGPRRCPECGALWPLVPGR